MSSSNSNLLCEQATEHYFDVLSGQIEGNVPDEVLLHIQQCDWCQAEIERLKATLKAEDAGNEAKKHIRQAVITNLSLQYAYAGAEVACDQVRPFLPSLADAVLETRVPTPITTHLDNCRQCDEDLRTIQKLNLGHLQLCRLGQLFAEVPTPDPKLCIETKKALDNMASLDFKAVSPEILKHVCLCPECRQMLADRRSKELGRIPHVPDGHLSRQDLFDFAVPYGAKHCNEFNESSASHISKCKDCYERMVSLHRTLFDIYTHPQSGTVTRFEITPVAQGRDGTFPDDADLPIAVEVTHRAAVMNTVPRRAKLNLKPFIKPAAVAAALLIGILLYSSISTAHAIDLSQIYSAVAKIANIHIIRFDPEKNKPVQERWVSRTLNISIYKSPTEMILWDIPNSSRRVKNLSTGKIDTTSLSSEFAAGMKKNIEGSLGLLPFAELSELPRDAKWQQVPAADIKSAAPDIRVYDLTWDQTESTGLRTFQKWRMFLDATTNLPQRIESYRKTANDSYVLTSYVDVHYISQSQFQTIIKDEAF